MKVHLMYPDSDFAIKQELPDHVQELTRDLELDVLFNAMAQDDEFLLSIVRTTLLEGTSDSNIIIYRQDILKDALRLPEVFRDLYKIASEVISDGRKRSYRIFATHPSAIVYQAVNTLKMFVESLKQIRDIADKYSGSVRSKGLVQFFSTLRREFPDEYFDRIQTHLNNLDYEKGFLARVQLGRGNIGTYYTLVKPKGNSNWFGRMLERRVHGYTIHINPRDDAESKILAEYKNRSLNQVANILAQSADYILAFFQQLRTELGFYVCCVLLQERLLAIGEPYCFPEPQGPEKREYFARGLYNIVLSLHVNQQIVGNKIDADGKNLWIVTGANQGGKSTFLKSIGLAQLMMQAGMFVPAESMIANTCQGVFTHFRREEDATMRQGKFDEELSRMRTITDIIRPNSLLLLNESFASTNEREGSEIAQQIIRSLIEYGVTVIFVTHLHSYAKEVYEKRPANVLFLRADRKADGTRPFQIQPGDPLSTSFGRDLYEQIFASKIPQL